MAWSHPDVSIDDLLTLVKAFVDMLVLASGYQSSGLPAKWDPHNVTKAIRWGLFFEDVMKGLRESSDYEGSVKELDAALADLASNPLFPKGLGVISSETLSEARILVIEHFLNSNPLSASHLGSLFIAAMEIDRDHVCELGKPSRKNYFQKLTAQMACLDLIPSQEEDMSNGNNSVNVEDPNFVCQLPLLTEKILKRRELVSCLSSCEKILKSFVDSCRDLNPSISSGGTQMIEELLGWKDWRSRCLSYMLDKRTIRILSGANLIFSAKKEQWMQVFEHLIVSSEENRLEVMEICLLGLVARSWNSFVEAFISHACDFVPVSVQFSKLCDFFQGNPSGNNSQDIIMGSKESDILDYVMTSLTHQLQKLWLIPPILFSACVPPWCPLFKIYMSELEKLFNGTCSTIRCNCTGDENKLHHRYPFTWFGRAGFMTLAARVFVIDEAGPDWKSMTLRPIGHKQMLMEKETRSLQDTIVNYNGTTIVCNSPNW